jgi:hypothetical protein
MGPTQGVSSFYVPTYRLSSDFCSYSPVAPAQLDGLAPAALVSSLRHVAVGKVLVILLFGSFGLWWTYVAQLT